MRAVVDVLDGGLAVAQARRAQLDLRAFGRSIGDLAVEQECELFGVGEIPGGICCSSSVKASAMPSSFSALSWSRVGWVSIAACLLMVEGGAADMSRTIVGPSAAFSGCLRSSLV